LQADLKLDDPTLLSEGWTLPTALRAAAGYRGYVGSNDFLVFLLMLDAGALRS
jgi:hypothetical protein